MRTFTSIGPLVRVDVNNETFYGQLKDNYLYMQIGCMQIPYDALITPMEVMPPLMPKFKLETKGSKTPYEKWQMETYGDFIKEDETAETHDDLKQWHTLD